MGLPLHLNNLKAQFPQPLSIVLYWQQPTGNDAFQNGHSALIIDSTQFDILSNEYYVSWLGQAQGRNPLKRRALAATFADDMRSWGTHPPGAPYKVPTRWVAVQNLNIPAMKQAWDQMRTKQGAHWKLMDKNCATSVARVLKAGGADNVATKAKNQLVWWPTDLITYARSKGNAIAARS